MVGRDLNFQITLFVRSGHRRSPIVLLCSVPRAASPDLAWFFTWTYAHTYLSIRTGIPRLDLAWPSHTWLSFSLRYGRIHSSKRNVYHLLQHLYGSVHNSKSNVHNLLQQLYGPIHNSERNLYNFLQHLYGPTHNSERNVHLQHMDQLTSLNAMCTIFYSIYGSIHN